MSLLCVWTKQGAWDFTDIFRCCVVDKTRIKGSGGEISTSETKTAREMTDDLLTTEQTSYVVDAK